MKKRAFTIMLVLGTVATLASCGKKNDVDFEKGEESVSSETTAEEYSSVAIDLSEAESSEEETTYEEEQSTIENAAQKSESAKSFAKDENVKEAQEAYMQTLHSVKGESIVTRIECDGVDYTEKVKTEQEGHIDVYYYSFSNTQKEYERMLKNYENEESCTIIEKDDQAFYIKVKSNKGQDTYFENVESAALRGNDMETYVE